MSQFARGIYRTEDPNGAARYAFVRYGSSLEMELSEAYYRERGYLPAFDSLPRKSPERPRSERTVIN
jgi:hypothetical protein